MTDATSGRERDSEAVQERRRRRQRRWWRHTVLSAVLLIAIPVMLLAGVPAFQDHQDKAGGWPLYLAIFAVGFAIDGWRIRRGQLDETLGDTERDAAERITGSRRQYKLKRGRLVRE